MTKHWTAIVAVIIALGVSVSIVVLAVSELDHGTAGHISEAETTLLATVLGAGIGAIATFLGKRPDDDPGDTQLLYRWPEVSRLKPPATTLYDQDESDPDATQEFPVTE